MPDPNPASGARRAAVIFVFITIVLDMVALGMRLPFWVAASFSLVNSMYGLFVLPESLPVERRAKFQWRRANPVGSLKLLRSHPELFGLAGSNFLSYVAHEVLPSTFVLYASYRYNWDERAVGLTLAAVGVCSGTTLL